MARVLMNKLVYHVLDANIKRLAKQHLKGVVLDIGCGEAPYKENLASTCRKHIGFDMLDSLQGAEGIDFAASAYSIPVRSESFDSIICTEVLEHLEEPELALKEAFRVLKPGGFALYSVPFIWHEHEEPRDFYRYTQFGLTYLFEKAGFTVVEVAALSGFCVTFGQLLVYYLYRFNHGPLRSLRIIPTLGVLIQSLAYLASKVDRAQIWTFGYTVVASK